MGLQLQQLKYTLLELELPRLLAPDLPSNCIASYCHRHNNYNYYLLYSLLVNLFHSLCLFVSRSMQSEELPKLTEELATPLKMMQDSARRIARVAIEAKLPLDEDSYVEKFKPHLMDVVFAWATVR